MTYTYLACPLFVTPSIFYHREWLYFEYHSSKTVTIYFFKLNY